MLTCLLSAFWTFISTWTDFIHIFLGVVGAPVGFSPAAPMSSTPSCRSWRWRKALIPLSGEERRQICSFPGSDLEIITEITKLQGYARTSEITPCSSSSALWAKREAEPEDLSSAKVKPTNRSFSLCLCRCNGLQQQDKCSRWSLENKNPTYSSVWMRLRAFKRLSWRKPIIVLNYSVITGSEWSVLSIETVTISPGDNCKCGPVKWSVHAVDSIIWLSIR